MPVPCQKLVHDRIPEIIQASDRHPVARVLDEAGYRQALLGKLTEEAAGPARASTEDLPVAPADVLEVRRALTAAACTSSDQLLALADDKRFAPDNSPPPPRRGHPLETRPAANPASVGRTPPASQPSEDSSPA